MPFQTSILLLDKPLGLSSNAALQKVRWMLGKPKPKAGHTGTLDPLATGMLPICLGEATKFAGYLLSESKCYRTRIALGMETASGDRDGEQVAVSEVPSFDADRLNSILAQFVGRIRQTPPIYSAIKQDGIALYKRARAGEVVQAKEREVQINRIGLLGFTSDSIDIEVECGSGTYIRSLGMDIAKALGTVGHLADLRRLWVSPFESNVMASLQDVANWVETGFSVQPEWLLPVEHGLHGFPVLALDAATALEVKQGRLGVRVSQPAGAYRLHDAEGRFFGLGDVLDAGLLRARRLLATGECN
jgi:tRNA pseudouridine55 synthase